MQCGAVWCSVVHGGAVCLHLQPYAMAPAVDIPNAAIAVCCSVLQCVAVCYTVLQCVAVCLHLKLYAMAPAIDMPNAADIYLHE